jgi:hypothetical protein
VVVSARNNPYTTLTSQLYSCVSSSDEGSIEKVSYICNYCVGDAKNYNA